MALAFYFVFAPETASLAELADAAGRRGTIEECFQRAKDDLGLNHREARYWHTRKTPQEHTINTIMYNRSAEQTLLRQAGVDIVALAHPRQQGCRPGPLVKGHRPRRGGVGS